MTDKQWEAFLDFKTEYKNLCDEWFKLSPKLIPLQKEAAGADAKYNVETAVVFNKAYDDVTKEDEINLIVIGDNPGKDEQLTKNNRYFVGKSGIVAENFFKRHPELNMDFRKKTIIMNKTPVHTAKTIQIKHLLKNGDSEIQNLIEESQIKCAQITAKLHQKLNEYSDSPMGTELWLVGHSELKKNGVFLKYRDELKNCYHDNCCWNKVFVYNHFSMSRFIVDLNEFNKTNPNVDLKTALVSIGTKHKEEVFGDMK